MSNITFFIIVSLSIISLFCSVLIPLAWAEKKWKKDRKKNSYSNASE